ncbi:MAG: hypothetical protein FDZ70_09125 [Actinobacteria bacterium]|nr:MAG: hypothetical protein FDZ70_09125 [Actinomycetota bacterium]
MPNKETQPAREPAVRRIPLPGRREAVLGALVAGLFAFIVWSAVASGAVGPDPACSPCHRDSALTGGHEGASCYGCHAGPEPASRAARFALDAAYAARGLPNAQAESAVSNDSCLSCHTSVLTSVVETAGIRMSHRTCVPRAARCTDCHSAVGHGRVRADRAVSMDRCSRCHDGSTAAKECDLCHYGTPTRSDALNSWAVTHGKNRHQTHGMGDAKTCYICHERSDCGECHLPVPHETDWPRLHGGKALDLGLDTCRACHVDELCDGCHKTEMPHPDDWLPRHSGAVPKSEIEVRCRSCHAVGDCRDCHYMHVHPGPGSARPRGTP